MAQICHSKEFRDNIHFKYGIIPLNLPSDYDRCGKKFTVEHDLSCPIGGLVLVLHINSEIEWGALGARGLNPFDISYEPHMNSRTVQGERTRAGSWTRKKYDWRGETRKWGSHRGGRSSDVRPGIEKLGNSARGVVSKEKRADFGALMF